MDKLGFFSVLNKGILKTKTKMKRKGRKRKRKKKLGTGKVGLGEEGGRGETKTL